DHVFNDVLYAAIFETLHGSRVDQYDDATRQRFGAAAALAFDSIARWQRSDPPYEGIYSITKNHFDPAMRVGYQPASQLSNYTATVAQLLAQCWWNCPEAATQPANAPVVSPEGVTETGMGGMAWNAQGNHAFMNLRGDTIPKYGT